LDKGILKRFWGRTFSFLSLFYALTVATAVYASVLTSNAGVAANDTITSSEKEWKPSFQAVEFEENNEEIKGAKKRLDSAKQDEIDLTPFISPESKGPSYTYQISLSRRLYLLFCSLKINC